MPKSLDGTPHERPATSVVGVRPRRSLWIALTVLMLAYAGLSHYSTTQPNAKGLGAALSLGPIVAVGVALLWRWAPRWAAALITLATAAAVYRGWPLLKENFHWVDLAQQVAIYTLVAWSFGRSLTGGRQPLCAQLAERLHGDLSSAEAIYLRRATVAWTLFYAALAAVIPILFFVMPLPLWSAAVNFGVFGLIAAMAVADFGLRRHFLPRRQGVGLLTALRQALIG